MIDDKYLISVIVPVYNVELYLKKCINSIINQTYKNIEIILIDDGSTDCSGRLCDELAMNDSRIQVIHKENGGLSDARNAGLNIANGEYYCFIDSDDYITDDFVEILLSNAIKNKSEIAVCNMIRFSDKDEHTPFYCPVEKETVYKGEERYKTLVQPSVCNKLFKASLFNEIRFPKGKYYEDTFIYHELLYQTSNVVLTGTNSYWYLQRSDSIVGRNQYTNQYFDLIEAVWKRANFLLEHNVPFYGEEACLSLYASYANAEKFILKTEENKVKFLEASEEYKMAYKALMKKSANVKIKQKIRLVLLRYIPKLHCKLY